MKKKPNILFIMTDQESVSLSACYGNKVIRTPSRDSIAENGVRFDNHYIASFPCSPSRATMITGLYAHNHKIVNNGIVLDPNMETLGSQLSKAGYETTWIGKSHLGGWFEPHDEETCPYHELLLTDVGYNVKKHPGGAGGEDYALNGFKNWVSGWTDYRNYLQTTDLPDNIKNDRWVGGHQVMETGPDSEHAYSKLTAEHHMENYMASQAVDNINQSSDDPFCMVLSFYGPHHPVAPPKPYDEMYEIEDMELPKSYHSAQDKKNLPGEENRISGKWTDLQAKGYLRRYFGYVTYIDDQITRVFDALKANGKYENTIIIFSSDHGDMLCEQGLIYKHVSNGYDTLMKVPMLIQWIDGIPKGNIHSGLSSHVDIVPTILELAGVECTADIDGNSIAASLVDNTNHSRNKIFIDVFDQGFVTRQGNWKFVLNASIKEGEMNRKIDELYDLKNDPNEIDNLALEINQTKRVETMKESIFAWLEETNHPYVKLIKEAAQLTQPI